MRAPGKSTKVSTLVGRALPSSLKCRVDEKRRKAFFKVSVNSLWNISSPMFSWSSVQEMSSTFHWAQRCPPGWRRSSGRRFSSKRHQGLPARKFATKFATKFANSQVYKQSSLQPSLQASSSSSSSKYWSTPPHLAETRVDVMRERPVGKDAAPLAEFTSRRLQRSYYSQKFIQRRRHLQRSSSWFSKTSSTTATVEPEVRKWRM